MKIYSLEDLSDDLRDYSSDLQKQIEFMQSELLNHQEIERMIFNNLLQEVNQTKESVQAGNLLKLCILATLVYIAFF